MIERPTEATRTDIMLPYTTLCRSFEELGEKHEHRVGAAEWLEATEAEARALVLVVHSAAPEHLGQAVEPPQRRRRVAGPAPDGEIGRASCRERVCQSV